ncbi:MAG: NACHT domain-containing protein [Planctomycetota bacterium]
MLRVLWIFIASHLEQKIPNNVKKRLEDDHGKLNNPILKLRRQIKELFGLTPPDRTNAKGEPYCRFLDLVDIEGEVNFTLVNSTDIEFEIKDSKQAEPRTATKHELEIICRDYDPVRSRVKTYPTDNVYLPDNAKLKLNDPAEGSYPIKLEDNRPSKLVRIDHLPSAINNFVGRKSDFSVLDKSFQNDETNAVEIVAFGGVGKSSLVANWLERISDQDWLGADFVFGYSFYSQGSNNESIATSDEFLTSALKHSGDPNPNLGTPSDKAYRFADLMSNRRALLILDGVEPLQDPGPSTTRGSLIDSGLSTLIPQLARKINGLLVLTTRVEIKDLNSQVGNNIQRINLKGLEEEDGYQLLQQFGVQGSKKQMIQAVNDYRGHAFALTLLATFLANTNNYNIENRFRLNLVEIEQFGEVGSANYTPKSFTRIMERYESWLRGDQSDSSRESELRSLALEILKITGLFDRPISKGEFFSIADSKIRDLTDHLSDAPENRVVGCLSFLAKLKLVWFDENSLSNESAYSVFFDTHPLVREYFADRLSEFSEHRRVWNDESQAGHAVLSKYLESCNRSLGKDFESCILLYRAVAHGCKAGHYNRVYNEILVKKIRQGNQFRSTDKLGLYNEEKAALFFFFEGDWSRPNNTLPKEIQFDLSIGAGYVLRALGENHLAVKPLSLAVSIDISEMSSKARAASLLASTYLAMGQMQYAVQWAEAGFAYAINDHDATVLRLASLGEVLHWCGETEQAECVLLASESKRNDQPSTSTKNSLGRHNLGELLLDLGRPQEALDVQGIDEPDTRAQTTALNDAIRVKSNLFQNLDLSSSPMQTMQEFRAMLGKLKELFLYDYIARNRLWRANLLLSSYGENKNSDFQPWTEYVFDDLSESKQIIERGKLKALWVDYFLAESKFSLFVAGSKKDATNYLERAFRIREETKCFYIENTASKMLENCGFQTFKQGDFIWYGRRDQDIRKHSELLKLRG